MATPLIKPFSTPEIVPPEATAWLARLNRPVTPPRGLQAPVVQSVQPDLLSLPPEFGAIEPGTFPADVPVTQGNPLSRPTADELLARDLEGIVAPNLLSYRPASSVAPMREFAPPTYDMEQSRQGNEDALKLAAIVQGISALAGGGGTRLGAQIGQGYAQGARQAQDLEFQNLLNQFQSDSQTEQRRFQTEQTALSNENRAIDQANDNASRQYQAAIDAVNRRYAVNSANDRAAETARLKATELANEKEVADRRADEAQLRSVLNLAKSGLLTEQGEADAAKLLSRLTKTGFSSNFLLEMSAEDRARITELGLSREQKERLAQDAIASREKIAKAHDTAIGERTKWGIEASKARDAANNKVKLEVAKIRKSRPGGLGADVDMELKANLRTASMLSSSVGRYNADSIRWEKLAQEILKNPENKGSKGTFGMGGNMTSPEAKALGLADSAYAQYKEFHDSAQNARRQAEEGQRQYDLLQASILGLLNADNLLTSPVAGVSGQRTSYPAGSDPSRVPFGGGGPNQLQPILLNTPADIKGLSDADLRKRIAERILAGG